MSTAKDIVIKVINCKSARSVIERYHYSGKCTQNSQLHFGVFVNGSLEGALQFGPSIDKRRMAKGLGVGFNEVIELNRMALSGMCPRNSESRAISICLKIIKKKYPHLKIVVSFADACQCGDGAIYRASGFKLIGFKKNTTLRKMPDGSIVADKTFNDKVDRMYKGVYLRDTKPIDGYQIKYAFFLDSSISNKIKSLDFSSIPCEAKMYRGKKNSRTKHNDNASSIQLEEGGSTPTRALQKAINGEVL